MPVEPGTDENADRQVTAIFTAVDPFEAVLDDLLKSGFGRDDVSVLAPHAVIADRFGRTIPNVRELTDRPDTPRQDLHAEGTLDALVHWIAETASVVGAVVAQGAAYAVGGPVGIATTTGVALEDGVERVLSDFVDDSYTRQYRETLQDGGLVCWVRVTDDTRAAAAREILQRRGGIHIHEVSGT